MHVVGSGRVNAATFNFQFVDTRRSFSPRLSHLLRTLPTDHFESTHSINNDKKVPETRGVEEGSAKRNITRKHDHDPHRKEKKQGGGAGGKGKWNPIDDGSL